MQRNVVNNPSPFIVHHLDSEYIKHPYYRFVIFPLKPSSDYVIKNGKLAFAHSKHTYHFGIDDIIHESNTSVFNIRAILANSYEQIASFFQKRQMVEETSTAKLLTIDIEKGFFDKNIELFNDSYHEDNSQANLNPLGVSKIKYNLDGYTYKLNFKINTEPFNSDDVVYAKTYNIHENSKSSIQMKIANPNPLLKQKNGNTYCFARLFNYGNEYGKDILFSKETPLVASGFRRRLNGLVDWYSHLHPNINRDSYLGLTKQLNEEKGNALKIAELFKDYAEKGSGFSAFYHFHWFRHKQNIAKAKEIVVDLSGEQYRNATNTEIATYLTKKFDQLTTKNYTPNPEGSFARRISYALLQLTNGQCHNIDEFREYRLQNKEGVESLRI